MKERIQQELGIPVENAQEVKNAKRVRKNAERTQYQLSKNAIRNQANAEYKNIQSAKNVMRRQTNINKETLRLFLNEYKNLTLPEKKQFLRNLENGVQLPNVQTKANAYAETKKVALMKNKIANLTAHMNRLGLSKKEMKPFLARANEPVNMVKNNVNAYFTQKYETSRAANRNRLVKNLQKYPLDRTDFNYLMKKYNETYIPPKKLINEAGVIAGFRKHERRVEIEEELVDYLNKLTALKPEDRRKITTALNSYYVNFGPLKKSATNMAIQSANAPRTEQRQNLIEHINKVGLKNRAKMLFLRNFDTNVANLNTLKAQVQQFKVNKNNEKTMKEQETFLKYLDTLLFLNDQNKLKLLNAYSIRGDVVRNEAKNLNVRRKNQGTFNLQRYIKNNLGLNEKNARVSKLISNYEKFPGNANLYMSKAQQIKAVSNAKTQLMERVKRLKKPERFENRVKNAKNLENLAMLNKKIFTLEELNTLNTQKVQLKERVQGLPNPEKYTTQINNARNLNDTTRIQENVNKAYTNLLRNELSNMTLQAGIKVDINLDKVATLEDAEQARIKLLKALNNKKGGEYAKLKEVVKNMAPQNQNTLLKNFVSINVSLKNVADLKKKRADEKAAAERVKLYELMNTELNMNVEDRKKVLNVFNAKPNLNTATQMARNLKQKRVAEKIANNRLKVEKVIEPLNLSNANRKLILNSFNAKPGAVLAFETQAKNLKKRRENEKRTNERQELLEHIQSLKLSETNTTKLLNIFDKNTEKRVSASKMNASNLRVQRNRERLTNVMKNLLIPGEEKTNILNNFRKTPSQVNALITKAKQINAKARGQLDLQKRLRNYVVSLRLGNSGANIIKKIDTTLTPQKAKTIKDEADKARAEANAVLIQKKRDEIRKFVNTTDLSANVKSSFVGGVQLNTNVDALKRKVEATVQNLKTQTSRRGKLRTELKVYLNTLNLTNDQKASLVGSVGEDTKSIASLKRKAKGLVKETERARLAKNIQGFNKKAGTARNQKKNARRKLRAVSKAVQNKRMAEEKAVQNKRMAEKPRLDKHLYDLGHLSKGDVLTFTKEFMEGKRTLPETFTLSTAKNKQNEQKKGFLMKFIPTLPMEPRLKSRYLMVLKRPRVNIDAIEKRVRAIIAKQMIPIENKRKLFARMNTLK